MTRIALRLAYDGTPYQGWQRQPDRPTVQGELERALARLFGRAPGEVPVTGAGRTDAGVHALEQVAAFDPPARRPLEDLAGGLARLLPPAIRVLGLAEVERRFHPRRDAVAKEYRYRIVHGRPALPFEAPWCWALRRPLDLDAMRASAAALPGRRDFAALASAGSSQTTTVRTLFRLDVFERDTGTVEISAVADGFLYRMVRNIVGLLAAAGEGRIPPGAVARLVAGADRRRLPPPAPPAGLALARVAYDPALAWRPGMP